MSVVLVVYRDSENLRLALERLIAQTAVSLLECVLVTPSKTKMDWVPSFLQSIRWQLVEVGSIKSAGTAKAAGVAAASAPLVCFLEDHSYPDPSWAESLIRAHENGEFAAVGPVVLNANPGTGASWGCFLVYYGQYMWARPQEQLEHLPANHSCYRRALLLDYGQRLPDLLEAEIMIHRDLLARGYRLFQEPSALTYHLNHSRLGPTIEEYFLASRVFAAERASGWGVMRRMLYAVGSPLLLLIRSARILSDVRHAGLQHRVLVKAIAPVLSTIAAGAAGEMVGYAAGAGRAKEGLQRFESRRHRVFTPGDLKLARMV
jgi:GT2 family glycosyltransferase